jgi:hypothetical protein
MPSHSTKKDRWSHDRIIRESESHVGITLQELSSIPDVFVARYAHIHMTVYVYRPGFVYIKSSLGEAEKGLHLQLFGCVMLNVKRIVAMPYKSIEIRDNNAR